MAFLLIPLSLLADRYGRERAMRFGLAGAALVAKEDTVPVIIDDALGFTDSDRLTKMAAVFNTVGTDGQVILLTCSPDRYAGIEGAAVIDLGT